MAIKAVRKTKSPPIMSHEFILQNHADIVSCVAMVFIVGLMFQVTNPLATVFVMLSYIDNEPATKDTDSQFLYRNGLKDICVVFFYSLICVVIHAVIQEYIIDKITKKLHMSKTKHNRFNESGQMLAFSLISTIWGINIIMYHGVMNHISSLWEGYPSAHGMPFQLKLFYVIQFAYWLHSIPELYFQKVKKDEWMKKLNEPATYFVFTLAAYSMNFTRVGLLLLVLRYLDEAVLQLCKLLNFAEKMDYADKGFRCWNVLFVCCRLISFILTILTFHYGLATLDDQLFSLSTGNFNTQFVRINSLTAVCLIQSWLMWNFIHFHLRRSREQRHKSSKSTHAPTASATKLNKARKGKRNNEDDVSMLPEVDQNSRRRR